MSKGRIVAGAIAPHPPHLVYAENPPQNEPRAECGWEELRWGYERLRETLAPTNYDVIVVHSPHWQTHIGHHVLGVDKFKGFSVDPVFPNLFRFHYDFKVDLELARALSEEIKVGGQITKLMTNPDFRVDYGTIISCHLVNPKWDKPIVAISANTGYFDFSNDVGQSEMHKLGQATVRAVERTGRRALLLASSSLSHRHFTVEGETPEDMSREHIYHHGQYLWDMKILQLFREGRTKEAMDIMPDFIDQSVSENKWGCISWLLAALNYPTTPGKVHAYGTVIGTGNGVVSWTPELSKERSV